jgi:hypothetical protein
VIPVTPQPEPPSFATEVRVRGQAFLRGVPRPNREQFKKNSYWRAALPRLVVAYRGICAYSALWAPTQCTVDHYLPKSTHPHLAYEWTNYRLALDKINSNKGDSVDVLDPFNIQPGWFILDLATLWVAAEPSLPTQVSAAVVKTISILRLNDDPWVQIRFEVLHSYLGREVTLGFLEKKYPFIAAEVKRQNIQPK